MTQRTRSTLQLDLKDISSGSAGPNLSKATMLATSLLVVGIAVASINSPPEEQQTADAHPELFAKDKTAAEINIDAIDAPGAREAVTENTDTGNAPIAGGNVQQDIAKADDHNTQRIVLAGLDQARTEVPMPLRRETASGDSVDSNPAGYEEIVQEVLPDDTEAFGATDRQLPAIALAEETISPFANEKPETHLVEPMRLHASSALSGSSSVKNTTFKLASLIPTPVGRTTKPLVNLIESDPISAANRSATADSGDNLAAENAQVEEFEVATIAPVSQLDSAGRRSSDIGTSIDNIIPDSTEIKPALVDSETEKKIKQLVDDADHDALSDEEWFAEKVGKKDTLSQIFNRLGLRSKEAYALVKLDDARPLTRIQPGQKIEVSKYTDADEEEKLKTLRFKLNRFDTLIIRSDGKGGYDISTEIREPEIRYATSSATIKSSLLGAAKRAGIPFDVVYELAAIFGWQVDFSKDLKKGDRFTVVYEELVLDGKKVGEGDVVAAELTLGGQPMRAVRHIDSDNRVTYYAPDGDGIQGSFLRSPLKFGRVSSRFSKKRFHPILKRWKAHKGVDYAAPMKTPIRATGDGVVKFAGTKKGYGRTLIVRHGNKYQTLYAHMNGFKKGVKSGARVKQGDVIGYVGKTGWTTGPHLHYEFRVNGRHVNPLTVELPKSAPIDKKYLAEFKANANRWVAALESREPFPVALNP